MHELSGSGVRLTRVWQFQAPLMNATRREEFVPLCPSAPFLLVSLLRHICTVDSNSLDGEMTTAVGGLAAYICSGFPCCKTSTFTSPGFVTRTASKCGASRLGVFTPSIIPATTVL